MELSPGPPQPVQTGRVPFVTAVLKTPKMHTVDYIDFLHRNGCFLLTCTFYLDFILVGRGWNDNEWLYVLLSKLSITFQYHLEVATGRGPSCTDALHYPLKNEGF